MTTPTERASHTPGPWRVGDAGNTIFGPPNGNPSPETIARNVSRAHARLIAAAPELLEALEDILEQAQIAVQRLNDALKADARTPGNAPFYISRLQRAFASIARAKGTLIL